MKFGFKFELMLVFERARLRSGTTGVMIIFGLSRVVARVIGRSCVGRGSMAPGTFL